MANTNGQVWALTTDGTSLFAGGSFTSINGQPTNRLVKLDPITGAVDTMLLLVLIGVVGCVTVFVAPHRTVPRKSTSDERVRF